MLRNRGIRSKLLAVLALPVIVLLIAATVVSVLQFQRASKASQVEQLARGAGTLGQLVSNLQAERSISQQWLEKRPVKDELAKARLATNQSLLQTRAVIGAVDLASLSPQATSAVAQAAKGHAALVPLRAQIDEGFADPDQVAAQYSVIVGYDITLPQRIGDGLEDREIGSQLAAYSMAQSLGELATQQREVGLDVIAAGSTDSAALLGEMSRLTSAQIDVSTDFRRNATPSQIKALDAALTQPTDLRAEYTQYQAALGSGNGLAFDFSSSDWRAVANPRIDALSQLGAPVAANTAVIAGAQASAARNRALLVLVGGIAIVLLVGGLGIFLARALTRPLRRLTAAASELSAELPKMVERMATPGEGPGVQLPDIPVTSKDEVGQLARAFKDVNETTVRVAEEQAALRASIAEMFVNVARRNHVLLSRQLSFIDQLERTEENPDTLDNLFKLDHLATRMRRNAESLIVLAGIDAGRRLRRPMPLSDVVRTAVSEIERYDRVDLSLQADPPLVGHVALTTAHMIAELLENATQFSNPDTRVVTSTAFSANGVRVTITDLGLGMTWDEINDANLRIANPPVTDVVGSQRLGFYVVGRLARRLDATVALRPGRTQGTVVTIDLPPALFVPGSVIELPSVIEDAPVLTGPVADHPVGPDSSTPSVEVQEPVAPAAEVSFPVVPVVPVVPVAPVVPAPTGLLPRRGEDTAAPVLEPRVPVSLPPSAPSAREGSGDEAPSLPRRSRSESPVADVPAAAVAEAEAEAETSGPRSGIFSGFRSRRAVDEPTETPVPVELPTERPFGVLEDEPAAEFVPTLEPSAALPSRGLPARGAAQVEDAVDAVVVDAAPAPEVEAPVEVEPVSTPVISTPVISFDEAFSFEPEAAYEPASFEQSSVELSSNGPFEPGPLDASWTPDEPFAEFEAVIEADVENVVDTDVQNTVEPVAEVEAEVVRPTVAQLVADAPTLQLVPDVSPAAALVEPEVVEPEVVEPEVVEPEVQPDAAVEVQPEPQPEPVVAQPVAFDGQSVRSELSELAREPEAPASFAPEVAVEAAQPVEQAPAFPIVGVPAMDILPTKGGGRGLRRRKPAKEKDSRESQPAVAAWAPPASPAAPAPRLPAARVPSDPPVDQPVFGGPAQPASSSMFTPTAAPFTAVSEIAPQPAAVQAPVEERPAPVAAPSSLFAPAPQAVATAPEPTPAIPALAAAQSLRERSAMASEALSELSSLSSYSPQTVQPAAPISLTRRTPQASPAGQMAQQTPEEPLGARRGTRNAADVRTMLSGFRAGVERGRTSPSSNVPFGESTEL